MSPFVRPGTLRPRARGFTLVEMVITIAITGIIAGMVAVFIRAPILGYLDVARRAALTDEADGALRFIAREIQSALPNSISCSNGPATLSFLPVQSGGRYREYAATNSSPTANTPLQFGQGVTSFSALGNAQVTAQDAHGQAIAAGSRVVVGNLGSAVSQCDASTGANVGTGTLNAAGDTVTFAASTTIPAACDLQAATRQDDPATANRNEENERGFGRFYFMGAGDRFDMKTRKATRRATDWRPLEGVRPTPR